MAEPGRWSPIVGPVPSACVFVSWILPDKISLPMTTNAAFGDTCAAVDMVHAVTSRAETRAERAAGRTTVRSIAATRERGHRFPFPFQAARPSAALHSGHSYDPMASAGAGARPRVRTRRTARRRMRVTSVSAAPPSRSTRQRRAGLPERGSTRHPCKARPGRRGRTTPAACRSAHRTRARCRRRSLTRRAPRPR